MIRKRAFFIILYILSFKLFAQKIHYLLPENKYIFEEQTVYNFDELPAEEQGEKNRKKLTVAYNFGDYFSTHYLNVIREENYFFHTIEVTDSNQKRYIVLIDDLIRENINQELHNKINGIWVVSYIFDILKSNSVNTLLEYEPFWQTEWKTSIGEDWKDDYFPSYIIITDNYIYISSYATGYRFYLIQNDMKNNRCKCYSKDKFVHGQVSAKNDFLTKLEGKEKENFYFKIDSDYLSLYIEDEKQEKLNTFVKIQDYKEIEEKIHLIIRGEKIDLSRVTWPRHADGSCDYETAVQLQSGKGCRASDNLRLRSSGSKAGKHVITIGKGTQVKVLSIGAEQTLDGIISNWVQVEVQAGAKDRDGKPIAAGTTGWCFGGYLAER